MLGGSRNGGPGGVDWKAVVAAACTRAQQTTTCTQWPSWHAASLSRAACRCPRSVSRRERGPCTSVHCGTVTDSPLGSSLQLHTSTLQLAAAAHALPLTWPWRSEPRCRRGSRCQRSSAPTCGTFVRRCIGSAAASGERAVPGPAPGLWQHAELRKWKTSTSSLHRMHLSLQTSTAGPLQISAWTTTPHHTTPLLDLRTAVG